jgi:UPF0755 protein
MMNDYNPELPGEASTRRASPGRLVTKLIISLVLLLVVAVASYLTVANLATAPDNFPVNTPIEIPPGTGVRAITEILHEAGVVRSDTFLYLVIILRHDPTTLKASTYVFENPQDVYTVARTLMTGDFGADLLSFTHLEGESVADVATRAAAVLSDFSASEFIAIATPHEGKLFPDTYRIPKDFSEQALYEKMRATYEAKLAPLRPQIEASGLTEYEVITLASIIEREANSPDSMKRVAGILRNRLDEGMYLQVDASIEYELDKPLAELTPEDLTNDTPYNTYTNPGLPPTPIGNPGLTSIMAVLEPIESDYFFYITDETGTFHYARTFDEHRINIARYLR